MTRPPSGPEPLRLADVRKRIGRSQAEVAHLMRTTQSGVSRIERQDDVRVSTLAEYADALGGRLRLIIECADSSFELALGGLDDRLEDERRSFRVIWQDIESRALVHVGWLESTRTGFEFSYTAEARRHERFAPFPAFPKLDEVYRSADLFPYFAVRLISAADPNYEAVLDAIGLTGRTATPAELLALAPDSQHDTIQVVPEPNEATDGTLERTFLVSGVRYADDLTDGAASQVIARLKPGARLELVPEPTNPHNPRAIQIVCRGTPLGWLPDYFVDEVQGYLATGRRVEVVVERANGPQTPSHVRLQCRLTIGPPDDPHRPDAT
jgi:transcriptional regulator with XRE-family HTH domain